MKGNRWLHILISVAVTALLLYAVIAESGAQGLVDALKAIDVPFLLIYLTLSIAALLMRAFRYRIVLATSAPDDAPPPVGVMIIVTAIRNALVDFLPARLGELSYLYVLNRYGISLAAGVTSFGVCFALDIVVLIVLILVLLLSTLFGDASGLSLLNGLSGTQVVMLFSTVGLLFTLGVVLLLRIDAAASFGVVVLKRLLAAIGLSQSNEAPKWFVSLLTFCDELVVDCRKLRESGRYGSLVLLTLGLRFAKYGSLYVLLLAVVGHWGVGSKEIGLFASTIGFLAAEAGASLPISGLMSFGAYEGAWSIVFGIACGEPCEALPKTTIALVVHLVTQVVGYGIGILAGLVFLKKLLGNAPKDLK